VSLRFIDDVSKAFLYDCGAKPARQVDKPMNINKKG